MPTYAGGGKLRLAAACGGRFRFNLFDLGMQLTLLQNNLCKGLTGLVPLPPTVISAEQPFPPLPPPPTFPPGGVDGGTSSGAITIPGGDQSTMAKFMAWGAKCSDPGTASTAHPSASVPSPCHRRVCLFGAEDATKLC